MAAHDLLIFIPTYNERDNIELIVAGLRQHLGRIPILFCDDNSPDGTRKVIEDIASVDGAIDVISRSAKLGIGSAHKVGLREAHRRGYSRVLTMDCDLTHQPSDCSQFTAAAGGDVVVGSRFADSSSLADWNWMRKALTHAGHFATTRLLGLPYDATGALRLYRLDRLGIAWVDEVRSDGYAFFFESLMVLQARGAQIIELPIRLPKRTYGSSKMSLREVARSIALLVRLAVRRQEISRHDRP
jgi:dolichol-phosphate mannosyltransferase